MEHEHVARAVFSHSAGTDGDHGREEERHTDRQTRDRLTGPESPDDTDDQDQSAEEDKRESDAAMDLTKIRPAREERAGEARPGPSHPT